MQGLEQRTAREAADGREKLGERYVVERVLGRKAEGRYMVAIDTVAGGRVTVLQPDVVAGGSNALLEWVGEEIRRLEPVAESGYCSIADAGRGEDGKPYLVVRRPQGTGLGAMLRDGQRFEPERAITVAIQLCDLVRRAHAVGIYPALADVDSVIVDPRPQGRHRVSAVSFGLLRPSFREMLHADLQAGAWCPPQLASDRADPRDDVFTLAAVLHGMLFGVAPPMMSEHGPADGSGWSKLPGDGRGLDRRLEACLHTVLLRGLARDRADRFPHIDALQRALTGLRQLIQLTAPAFELMAATRGRLGQGRDPLDLAQAGSPMERAAEARARIREVIASAGPTGARLSFTPEPEPEPLEGESTVDFAGGAQPAQPQPQHPAQPALARIPLARRSVRLH
jgi:hypothetical protein